MFKFLGTGSALNPKLGNNAAILNTDDETTIFMIDCGETTYERLCRSGYLENPKLEQVIVLMTHTHPDHFGSLGTLCFEMYFRNPFKPRVSIIAPIELEIERKLNDVGVTPEYYIINDSFVNCRFTEIYLTNIKKSIKIFPIPVSHDKKLKSFAYIITFDEKTAYFSGDAKEIPNIAEYLLLTDQLDYFYQDTSTNDYEDNIHLSLKKLNETIPMKYRKKVWCMHLDRSFDREFYESFGFNCVKSIFE